MCTSFCYQWCFVTNNGKNAIEIKVVNKSFNKSFLSMLSFKLTGSVSKLGERVLRSPLGPLEPRPYVAVLMTDAWSSLFGGFLQHKTNLGILIIPANSNRLRWRPWGFARVPKVSMRVPKVPIRVFKVPQRGPVIKWPKNSFHWFPGNSNGLWWRK